MKNILTIVTLRSPNREKLVSAFFFIALTINIAAFAQQSVGPIPDFDELEAVVLSENLIGKDNGEKLIDTLLSQDVEVWIVTEDKKNRITHIDPDAPYSKRYWKKLLALEKNPKFKKMNYQNDSLYWTRDWAPIPFRTADSRRVFTEFGYYKDSYMSDKILTEVREGKYEIPLAPFFDMMPSNSFDSKSVQVVFEGGNFLTDGNGNCFSSDRLFQMNFPHKENINLINNKKEILSLVRTELNCKTFRVFPAMPYDLDNHIDLYAQFVDKTTAIVAEISEQSMAVVSNDKWLRNINKSVAAFLHSRASDLKKLGYKVVRIPLPVKEDNRITRSYINNILVNGAVILPRFVEPYPPGGRKSSYLDATLLGGYEKTVEETYKRLGFKTFWVESDSYSAGGGALHCISRGIPAAK